MNLRFVEAFHWAVALRSISRAAEKLHITQSALSNRIIALEEELGVAFLDRRDKQFRLTSAGQRFHVIGQKMLELQRQAFAETGKGSMRPLALRVGAIESVVHSWLTGWLHQMRSDYASCELEVTVETSPVLVDQVRRGSLDIVFASIAATDPQLQTRLLPAMEMSFVGHKALHTTRLKRFSDIAAHDLLTFQRGSIPHVALLDLLRKTGVLNARVHTISSISAMTQLVEGGFGLATLPTAVARGMATRMPLRILSCMDAVLAPLPIFASYREDPTSETTTVLLESAVAYMLAHRQDSGQG